MSELTKCNWCHLQQLKEEAERRGARVTLVADQPGVGPFWVAVKVSDRTELQAWFLEVPLECAC